MANLFRREVFESHRQAWLGTVQLTRPVPLWVATGFVLGVAILVFAFLWTGEYARKARVTGFLAPDRGVIRLVAPQAATVVEAHAREGQKVRQGDTLFVLAVGQSSPSGDTQAAVETSLTARQQSLRGSSAQQSELEAARLAALDRRIEAMQRELGPMAEEQALQRKREQLAEEALAQYKAFRAENYVSDAQVRTKSEELLGVKAQLISAGAAARRPPARDRRAAGRTPRAAAALPRAPRARSNATSPCVAQQSAENAARQRIVVRAPQDGTVSAVRRRGRAERGRRRRAWRA